MAVDKEELHQEPMGDRPLPEGTEEHGETRNKPEEGESCKELYEEKKTILSSAIEAGKEAYEKEKERFSKEENA